MAVFKYAGVPSDPPPRPLDQVLAAIRANTEAQQRVLDDPTICNKAAAIADLQSAQRALYREKRLAEFARAGVKPGEIAS